MIAVVRICLSGGEKAMLKRRSQYCMEVEYSAAEVPEEVHSLFRIFNQMNQLVKDLIERCPPLQVSVELLVGEEEKFKRDILVSHKK